jgi:hypothetical protein
MKTEKIHLKSDIHYTVVTVAVVVDRWIASEDHSIYDLSAGQIAKIEKGICGMQDCECGSTCSTMDNDVVYRLGKLYAR